MKDLSAGLARRLAQNLYRRRQVLEGPQGVEAVLDGRRVLSFCSNDYLGLANHPQVVEALQRGARAFGVGAGAAHLVSGHRRAHHDLEQALAELTGYPRALLFSTGYMANLGVMGALAGRHDRVFEDRLNHASLLDGARYAGARLIRYPHGDVKVLAARLAGAPADAGRLVASDGVFSMDGDLAPLAQLAQVARRHGAWLLVDDAHGLGVLGARGGGSLEHHGLAPGDVPILMGTLGKALGTFGAFVAGSEALIETLIQEARPYVYTTALPPALAVATLAALRVAREEAWRRHHLQALVARLRAGGAALGLNLMPSATPIQPLVVGEADAAVAASEALLARGILVSAIRPPTVAAGSARLRITLSAAHTTAHVDRLVETLAEIARSAQLGLVPRPTTGAPP